MAFSRKPLPSLQEVEIALAHKSLAWFIRGAWATVEPSTPLQWNWHIEAICEHLEAVTRREIKQLLVNIPPGHMKSLIAAVFWPAWEWLHKPGEKTIFGSYAADLAIRDSVKCRDLILSPWYQDSFRPEWKLSSDQNVKSSYRNTSKGERLSLSVSSKATGFRGDKLVVDDPLNAKEAYSKTARDEANDWFFRVMSTRVNDPATAARVVIMQRLHDQDVSGMILERGGFEHLCLPSEFDSARRIYTSIGWTDPRADDGELLFPEKYSSDVLAQAKKDLGDDYEGQHNQRPNPADGAVFQDGWWKFWKPIGSALPEFYDLRRPGSTEPVLCEVIEIPREFDETVQSWDLAFKKNAGTDRVAGGVWSRKGARKFLRDQVCDRMTFVETLDALRKMVAKWPNCRAIYIEDKANGPAVMSMLGEEIPCLVPVEPEGGKETRAHAVSPQVRAGNVYLPHPAIAPWVMQLIGECRAFPKGANDDQVDQMTQALTQMIVTEPPPSSPTHRPLKEQSTYKPWDG